MSPELLHAVKERLELGHTHDAIREELRSVGYDDATIEAVLQSATTAEGASTPTIPQPQTATELIGYSEIISQGWDLMKQKKKELLKALATIFFITIVILTPLILLTIDVLGSDLTDILIDPVSVIINPAAWILFIVAMVLFMVAQIALSIVSLAMVRNFLMATETFGTSFKFIFKRFWSILLIVVLVSLITQTGSLLLILPGIALSFYLMFATYIFFAEQRRGMAALIHSTELVFNRWWKVFARTAYLGLVSSLLGGALLVVPVVIWGVASSFSDSVGANFFGQVLIPVGMGTLFFIAIFIIISFSIAGVTALFRSLQAVGPVTPFTEKRQHNLRTLYIVLAVLGVVASLLGNGGNFMSMLQGEPEYGGYEQQINPFEAKNRAIDLRLDLPNIPQ